jgi:ABC-type amino acid transport substrate-binding protein
MDSKAEVGQPVSDQFSDLKVAVRIRPSEQGVMVRKGSDLKPSLDAYIDTLRKSGELGKLLAKYGEGPGAPKK